MTVSHALHTPIRPQPKAISPEHQRRGRGGQVGRGQGAHLEAVAQRAGDPSAGRACDCQGGLFDEMGNHHRPHIRRARQKIIRESRSMNVRAAIGSRRIGGAQRRIREGIGQRAEDFRGGQADAEHRRGEGSGFEARRAIGERGIRRDLIGVNQMPQLEGSDGTWLTDTTAILRRFERTYAGKQLP